jgi:hypothetical protein
MFGKLARAVLAIDGERRTALLRRSILPGLLDGRAGGAVLRDFPDPDLAESLCLLLELETAAPEVVGAALNKLELPAERHDAVVELVNQRLRGEPSPAAPAADHNVDRYARRLVRVDATAGRNFAEFAAFDLSIDERHFEAVDGARRAIVTSDVTLTQLDCLRRVVRLQPNPTQVKSFMRRALGLLGDLHHDGRWADLVEAATRFRRLTYEVNESRPDVAAAIDGALGDHWSRARAMDLVALHDRDPEGRAVARAIVEAFGPSIASGLLAVLADPTAAAAAGSAVTLMSENAALLAPALAARVNATPLPVAGAIVRVLAVAGAGYEPQIAGQLARGDEQLTRAALKALARIGTGRAAALVAVEIQSGGAAARAAEAALWHFPPAQATIQIRDLLRRRDFVLQHPAVVARLIDRAAQWDACDLGGVLEELESLRFHVWNPELVRMARKARGLRGR